MLDEYTLREKFLIRDDETYSNFWDRYGGTSEVSNSTDDVLDYQRPILNPSDGASVPNGAERDEDGLVYRIVDCFGAIEKMFVIQITANSAPGTITKSAKSSAKCTTNSKKKYP